MATRTREALLVTLPADEAERALDVLAEGLPAVARMEMALPPALSVLARALSRRVTVIGFAARDKPSHFVGVAFRGGRAADVITMVKDRIVVGVHGAPERCTLLEAKTHLLTWLAPYDADRATTELLVGDRDLLVGDRDLPATWRVAYLHGSQ